MLHLYLLGRGYHILRQSTENTRQNKNEEIVFQGQPRLEEGINLVEKEENMAVFQSLLASELDSTNSKAVWIDTGNEASTYALREAGSPGILEKVSIGRAFTPFQHHSLIQSLEQFVENDTEIIVIPNIDYLYVDGQIRDWEAKELFQETWDKVKEIQEEYELKIVLSTLESNLGSLVRRDTVKTIRVEESSEGWRYESDEFDQSGYKNGNGVQTTVNHWIRKKREKVKLLETI